VAFTDTLRHALSERREPSDAITRTCAHVRPALRDRRD
jgi:hypothetical protein